MNQNKDPKLDFFLSLASMDQQLALVVYESDKQLEQIREFIEEKSDKQFEVDSLDEFDEIDKGYTLFKLTEKNLDSVLESIKETQFKPFVKAVFVLEKNTFKKLDDIMQEQTLTTFSPIFR